MDSSESMKWKACVSKKNKKTFNSEKTVPDSNKNISSHLESSMAKFDGSCEIGDDGSYYECELCNDCGELLCCEACPRTYHLECLGLKSVPKAEWHCTNCFDDNQVSMSIKHFKNLNFKKDISSEKVNDGSPLSRSKDKKGSK